MRFRSVFTATMLVATPLTGLVIAPTGAFAHAVCGNRVFPATIAVDDPGVGDELSLPTITYTPSGSAGGTPTTTYGFEWDKTITEHFGFSISDNYLTLKDQGVRYQGFDNIDAGLKYEFYCNPDAEFMASIGIDRTFAHTGSRSLIDNGYIDSVSSTSPTLYVGKGLGDLPIGFLRPLAITGEVSYQISDRPGLSPNAWNFGGTLQYSIPYLQEHVKQLGLPDVLGHLTPLVEVNFNMPNGGPNTGTISPGVLYDADTWQVGVEAVLPINNVTRQNQGIGVVAQVHFFLDDIFPNSVGKPLFGGAK